VDLKLPRSIQDSICHLNRKSPLSYPPPWAEHFHLNSNKPPIKRESRTQLVQSIPLPAEDNLLHLRLTDVLPAIAIQCIKQLDLSSSPTKLTPTAKHFSNKTSKTLLILR